MSRTPSLAELPGVAAYLARTWARGRLGHIPFSEARAVEILGLGLSHPDTFFLRVAGEGEIKGVLLGNKAPVYLAVEALEAMDIVWVADPGYGRTLLREFHRWAWSDPKVVRVRHALVDTMGEVSETATGILRRGGFRTTGSILEKERSQ